MRKSRERGSAKRVSGERKSSSTTRAILGEGSTGPEGARVDPKWTWHYRVLLGLRERLLKDRVGQLARVAEPLESHSMDMADSATDEFDHNLALSGLSAQQDALYEVEEALKRILNGTYGTCEESGKPIGAARLRAVPWTRYRKGVAKRLEGDGTLRQAHLGNLGTVRGEVTGDLEESESEEEKQLPPSEDESLRTVPGSPFRIKRQAVPQRRKPNRLQPKTREPH